MFRRKDRSDAAAAELPEAEDVDTGDELDSVSDSEPEAADIPVYDRSNGPWDDEDAPEAERIDLGGVLVPQLADVEWRADVDPTGATVVAVTAIRGDGAVQIQAFAAPRTEPLWPEVLAEIEANLVAESAAPQRVTGTFGTELAATVGPANQRVPAVFAGIDGPRWLLRLVFTGTAADAAGREPLDAVVRAVVVVRGAEPMAPRDLIPLRLPAGLKG